MRIAVTALALASMVFAASSALAQNVGVMPVKGTNLSEGEAAAIGVLITSAYAAQVDGRVLGPDETGPVLAQSGTEKDAATQLVLAEYIVVSAVKLDRRIALDATLYNKHGSRLYQTRATAMSIDDMQAVSERMAVSLHRRTELEHTRTIDNVTEVEAQRPTRTSSEKVIGIRTGVVLPFAPGFDTSPGLLAQFDARLEGRTYFVEFAGGFLFPSRFDSDGERISVGGLIGHIGGSLYLSHTSVSPYVGAAVSPRLLFGDYNGGGLAAGGQIGLMFMREASTRLYVELRIDQSLVPMSVRTYSGAFGRDPDRTDVFPTELSLAAGIGW